MAIFNILQNIKKQYLVNALRVTIIGSVQFLQKADVYMQITKQCISVHSRPNIAEKTSWGCLWMYEAGLYWVLHGRMCTPCFPCVPHHSMLKPQDIPSPPPAADKGLLLHSNYDGYLDRRGCPLTLLKWTQLNWDLTNSLYSLAISQPSPIQKMFRPQMCRCLV